jgi:phospholipase C
MNSSQSHIQHVIVLMFENRSFDHLLGAMPGVNGLLDSAGNLKPDLYNTPNPLQPAGPDNPKTPPFPIVPNLPPQPPQAPPDENETVVHDFNHDFGDGMLRDIFGPGTTGFLQGAPQGAPVTFPPQNAGFFSTPLGPGQTPDGATNGSGALSFFQWKSLRVFHTLAQSFVVCDAWHCDMPGHTGPNRAFMHCATTGDVGICDDDGVSGTNMINRETIFERLQSHGRTWKMYTPKHSQCDTNWLNERVLSQQWNPDPAKRAAPNVTEVPMGQFFRDLKDGTLPFYSFIMCWNGLGVPDTSMHPNSAVEAGEEMLACVYNALQASPYWENTLLIVNFDENGGIYDHHSAGPSILPAAPAPDYNPNSQAAPPVFTWTSTETGQTYSFDFTALGVRIPALLISPWLKAGVCHTQFQNTSILRFLQDMLREPPAGPSYLTQRDLYAPTIAPVFDLAQFGTATMRTDCPTDLQGYGLGVCAALQSDDFLSDDVLASAPAPHVVKVTLEYLSPLPGHADSGRPLARSFATIGNLIAYARERKTAALTHIGAKCPNC